MSKTISLIRSFGCFQEFEGDSIRHLTIEIAEEERFESLFDPEEVFQWLEAECEDKFAHIQQVKFVFLIGSF